MVRENRYKRQFELIDLNTYLRKTYLNRFLAKIRQSYISTCHFHMPFNLFQTELCQAERASFFLELGSCGEEGGMDHHTVFVTVSIYHPVCTLNPARTLFGKSTLLCSFHLAEETGSERLNNLLEAT